MKSKSILTTSIVGLSLFLTACNQQNNGSSFSGVSSPQAASIVNTNTSESNSISSGVGIAKTESNQPSAAILEALKQSNYQLISFGKSALTGFTKVKVLPSDNQNVILGITMSDDGKYFFNNAGQLLNIETNSPFENVLIKTYLKTTAKYVDKGFDSNKTFKITKGNGSRKLAVFTDPDCPFCKRLEKTMEGLDDVEITYIYFPINQLHPDAENKTNQLWAVAPENRAKVWTEFLATGQLPESNAVNLTKYKYDYNYKDQLQKDFNINGTPTLFNIKTGEVKVGALELGELNSFLNEQE